MAELSAAVLGNNVAPFLDTIAFAEGVLKPVYQSRDRGYDVIVGGELMTNYRDHPRQAVWIKSIGQYSTAAGRYQILARNFDHYRKQLAIKDFSPAAQDLIALQLLRECRVLPVLAIGDVATAFTRARSRWASLPGAGYGQPEKKLDELLAYFRAAGGWVK